MENEKRLIDANECKKRFNPKIRNYRNCVESHRLIDSCPTVDAVEVVHGRWGEKILAGGFSEEWGYVCSECRCTVSEKSRLGKYQGRNQQLNYCPNCGAKMDGGNEDG